MLILKISGIHIRLLEFLIGIQLYLIINQVLNINMYKILKYIKGGKVCVVNVC